MMEPTIGRIIYYHKNAELYTTDSDRPYAAIITTVNTDGTVSLCVFDTIGQTYGIMHIRLIQPNEPIPNKGQDYCAWMPYQVGKAKEGDHNSESAEPRPSGD